MPNVGRPVMKARVPSIGSSTQRSRESGRSSPNSSPSTPCSGKRSARTARIACSALRSAMVTGERSGREVLYRLVDHHLAHIVVDAVAHAGEDK